MEHSRFASFMLVTLTYKNLSAQDFITSAILGLNDGDWVIYSLHNQVLSTECDKTSEFFSLN